MRVKISVRAECSPVLTSSTNGEQAERVVAPDDVAEDLVVAPVVRRIDDPLVLPAAPRVRARPAERDSEVAHERMQLRAPLAHARRSLGEPAAAAGADLDLGRDQLAHEVR